VGEWQFDLADRSGYYGFGERFDRLNHEYSIVQNASRDAADAKGLNTYQPVPFFMSLRGYGLWVDTFSEAAFDLNVTERYRVRVKVWADKFRFVLFEGPRFPLILDRFTALAGRLLVAPVLSPVTQRAVYLPEGNWIDYWSGERLTGRHTITADAPLDRIPLYVREGAILPKIPDDVMTLVPPGEYKDRSVKSLDDRRVYEIYPGASLRPITDFEGRTVAPGQESASLVITGQPARVILRWRFNGPMGVSVNDRKLDTVKAADGSVSVEFHHQATSRLRLE